MLDIPSLPKIYCKTFPNDTKQKPATARHLGKKPSFNSAEPVTSKGPEDETKKTNSHTLYPHL